MYSYAVDLASSIPSMLVLRSTLFGLVFLRALPIVIYIIFSKRFSAYLKIAVVVAAVVWFAMTRRYDPLVKDLTLYSPLVFGYFASVVGLSILACRAGLRLGRFNVFFILTTLFVLIPSVLPFGRLTTFAVILGWEMLLASYSICVDAYKENNGPTASEHAFFVLVNPVLVYAERGRYHALCRPTALLRSIAGILVLFGGMLVSSSTRHLAPRPLGLETVLACIVALFATYWQHSGLASLQIGFMRFIGYDVPERYRYPIFATSPMEFWRRWNTYLGSWARRYLFNPTVLSLGRTGVCNRAKALGIGAVTTFLIVGLLHELTDFVTNRPLSLRWVVFFILQGLTLICWEKLRETWRPLPNGRFMVSITRATRLSVGWVTTLSMVLLGGAFMLIIRHL